MKHYYYETKEIAEYMLKEFSIESTESNGKFYIEYNSQWELSAKPGDTLQIDDLNLRFGADGGYTFTYEGIIKRDGKVFHFPKSESE